MPRPAPLRVALAATFVALASAEGVSPSGSTVRLNNGVDMPLLSYGANVYDVDTCKTATEYALQAGFRFIWSSAIIGEQCQQAQYQAITSSTVPRKEIFLAGTVDTQRCAGEEDCYAQTKYGAQHQLEIFGNTTLDMVMLDYPSGAGCPGITGQWKALKEFYAAGQVRTIAVSNFDVDQLKCAAAVGPTSVVPSVNQMPFNADSKGDSVVSDDGKLGVVVQAYSPLGSGMLIRDPVLVKIGQAHGKSAAQVALRWVVQQGVGVNLASTSLDHLKEDAALFDFELSEEEVKEINNRSTEGRFVHHI